MFKMFTMSTRFWQIFFGGGQINSLPEKSPPKYHVHNSIFVACQFLPQKIREEQIIMAPWGYVNKPPAYLFDNKC